MNRKRWIVLAGIAAMAMLATACDFRMMYSGSNVGSKVNGSYRLFSGKEVKKLSLEEGETIVLNYKSEVEKGELSIKLYDPDHELVKEFAPNEEGQEQIQAKQAGTYKLEIQGKDTKGSFEVSYAKQE